MARLLVSAGNLYTVDSAYRSPDETKKFELFRIADDKKKNEITCFLSDKSMPANINAGDRVKINNILSVALGWKRKKVWNKEHGAYEEKWVQEYSLTVDAVKVASDLDDVPDGLPNFDDMNDLSGELPWIDELPL